MHSESEPCRTPQAGDGWPDEIFGVWCERVEREARRLVARTGQWHVYEDLRQAGLLALLECWEKYDPSRGTAFLAYAAPRVVGTLMDNLDRHTARRSRSRRRAYWRLVHKGVSRERASVLVAESHVDRDRRWEEESRPIDLPGPDEITEHKVLRQRVRDLLDQLPPEQRFVLELYFGENERSLSTIARMAGRSRNWVIRVREEGIARMRFAMGVPGAGFHAAGKHLSGPSKGIRPSLRRGLGAEIRRSPGGRRSRPRRVRPGQPGVRPETARQAPVEVLGPGPPGERAPNAGSLEG